MKRLSLRLPDDIHQMAEAAADEDHRSLNSWLVTVVHKALQARTPNTPSTKEQP